MVFRMGGGAVAAGVHWHIASRLWYLPLDEARQEIGWVQVQDANGVVTEYVDPERRPEITQERIGGEKRFFDCMDCHNRVTHIFRSPDELMDAAIVRDDIPSRLPFIKREGLKGLDVSQDSLEEAQAKADALVAFYRESYPEVYRDQSEEIEKAAETLKELAEQVIFP